VKPLRRIGLSTLGVSAALLGVYLVAINVRPSERRPGVTLLVNHSTRVEVAPGAPLLFEISISDGPNDPPLQIGSRWRAWHRLVRLERLGGDELPPWRLQPVGEPRSLKVERDSEGRSSLSTPSGAIAQLGGGRSVHTVAFSASPEETTSVAPGDYLVRAVLETPFWLRWGWHGRTISAPARVTVRRPASGPEQVRSLESERLAGATRHYLSAGRSAEALRFAQELATLEPERARSHVLLGDALALQRSTKEALSAYRRAMKLVPRSYDEPEPLRQRIDNLMRDEEERARRGAAAPTAVPRP